VAKAVPTSAVVTKVEAVSSPLAAVMTVAETAPVADTASVPAAVAVRASRAKMQVTELTWTTGTVKVKRRQGRWRAEAEEKQKAVKTQGREIVGSGHWKKSRSCNTSHHYEEMRSLTA
jgi:hypothetical protein